MGVRERRGVVRRERWREREGERDGGRERWGEKSVFLERVALFSATIC